LTGGQEPARLYDLDPFRTAGPVPPGKGAVMDRLSPLSAIFIDAEDGDRHVSMAIASIAVFRGPGTVS